MVLLQMTWDWMGGGATAAAPQVSRKPESDTSTYTVVECEIDFSLLRVDSLFLPPSSSRAHFNEMEVAA